MGRVGCIHKPAFSVELDTSLRAYLTPCPRTS